MLLIATIYIYQISIEDDRVIEETNLEDSETEDEQAPKETKGKEENLFMEMEQRRYKRQQY